MHGIYAARITAGVLTGTPPPDYAQVRWGRNRAIIGRCVRTVGSTDNGRRGILETVQYINSLGRARQ